VVIERPQFLEGHAAVIVAGVPALHQGLVPVAERSPGEELAVELLEDLEAGIGRGPRCRLLLLLLRRRFLLFLRRNFRSVGGLWLGLLLLGLIRARWGLLGFRF